MPGTNFAFIDPDPIIAANLALTDRRLRGSRLTLMKYLAPTRPPVVNVMLALLS